MENLQKRKEELVGQIGEDEIKKLKKVKLLKLIQNEIQELLNYWTLKQVHQMINNVFNIPISSPLFYRYCRENFKKDEKSESVKTGKIKNLDISQKRDTKKELILDEDELNAVAMFGSSSKNQLKD